jgi:hypothetical protein
LRHITGREEGKGEFISHNYRIYFMPRHEVFMKIIGYFSQNATQRYQHKKPEVSYWQRMMLIDIVTRHKNTTFYSFFGHMWINISHRGAWYGSS